LLYKLSYLAHVYISNGVYFFSLELKIAGHTTEFVNGVLDKVKNGVPGGGLEEI
jgi:hypothetical protein